MIKVLLISALVAAISGQAVRYRYAAPTIYDRPAHYHPRNVYYAPNVADPVVRDQRVNAIDDETPKPYSFSYSAPLDDGVGSSSRTEVADGSGRVEGSYTLTNDEGHSRVVEYVADEGGFRATVRTNEPGTSNQSPASVVLESTAPTQYDYQPEARYRPARPVAAALRTVAQPVAVEEPIVVEQPVDHHHAAVPVAPLVARSPAFYDRRPYYPQYRRNYPYYY